MKVRFIFLILVCSNLVESSETQIGLETSTVCGFNTASNVLPQIYNQAGQLLQELTNAVDVLNTIKTGNTGGSDGSATVPCACSKTSSSSSSSTPCSTWSVPTFDYSFLTYNDFALSKNTCTKDIPGTYSPFGACTTSNNVANAPILWDSAACSDSNNFTSYATSFVGNPLNSTQLACCNNPIINPIGGATPPGCYCAPNATLYLQANTNPVCPTPPPSSSSGGSPSSSSSSGGSPSSSSSGSSSSGNGGSPSSDPWYTPTSGSSSSSGGTTGTSDPCSMAPSNSNLQPFCATGCACANLTTSMAQVNNAAQSGLNCPSSQAILLQCPICDQVYQAMNNVTLIKYKCLKFIVNNSTYENLLNYAFSIGTKSYTLNEVLVPMIQKSTGQTQNYAKSTYCTGNPNDPLCNLSYKTDGTLANMVALPLKKENLHVIGAYLADGRPRDYCLVRDTDKLYSPTLIMYYLRAIQIGLQEMQTQSGKALVACLSQIKETVLAEKLEEIYNSNLELNKQIEISKKMTDIANKFQIANGTIMAFGMLIFPLGEKLITGLKDVYATVTGNFRPYINAMRAAFTRLARIVSGAATKAGTQVAKAADNPAILDALGGGEAGGAVPGSLDIAVDATADAAADALAQGVVAETGTLAGDMVGEGGDVAEVLEGAADALTAVAEGMDGVGDALTALA